MYIHFCIYIYIYVKFKVSESKFKSSGPGITSIITILINQHHQHHHHHHQVTQLPNNNNHHHDNHHHHRHHHHHHHHHHFSPLTTVANHRRCHCRGCCSFTASLAKDRLVIGKKLKINWLLGRIDKGGKSSAAVTFPSGFEEAVTPSSIQRRDWS